MKIADKLIKGAKSVTISFLGDSVTQGCFEVFMTGENSLDTVYSYKDSYSTRLRELLNLLYPNLQVNIINSGLSGDTAARGFERAKNDKLLLNADLLVVSYGLNDAAEGGKEGADAYADALRSIFGLAASNGCEALYLTQNFMNTAVSPHIEQPFLIELAKNLSRLQNGGVLKQYFEKGKQAAAECGATVCDCYAVWESMSKFGVNTTDLLANYLNHPIKEYHKYVAVKLAEKIMGVNI